MKKNTLHKNERLKSRKAIEQMFRNGKARFSPPYRVLYRIHDLNDQTLSTQKNAVDSNSKLKPETEDNSYDSYSIQENNLKMTVAVPKKMIKLAVNRNLLKRRTREIYRQKNSTLKTALQEKNLKMELLFLYQTSEILDSSTLKRSITFLLQKLETEILDHTS